MNNRWKNPSNASEFMWKCRAVWIQSTLHITAITATSSCNLSLMLSIWERLKGKFQIRGRKGEKWKQRDGKSLYEGLYSSVLPTRLKLTNFQSHAQCICQCRLKKGELLRLTVYTCRLAVECDYLVITFLRSNSSEQRE